MLEGGCGAWACSRNHARTACESKQLLGIQTHKSKPIHVAIHGFTITSITLCYAQNWCSDIYREAPPQRYLHLRRLASSSKPRRHPSDPSSLAPEIRSIVFLVPVYHNKQQQARDYKLDIVLAYTSAKNRKVSAASPWLRRKMRLRRVLAGHFGFPALHAGT